MVRRGTATNDGRVTRVGSSPPRTWRSAARADDEGLRDVLAALGKQIATLRQAATLTQEALASKASIDSRHLQDLEYGRSNVTIATLRSDATALGVTVAELLRGVC